MYKINSIIAEPCTKFHTEVNFWNLLDMISLKDIFSYLASGVRSFDLTMKV